MRILILAPSLSGSSYLIPYLYAKVLMRKHDVKIVGPTFGKPRFVADDSVDVEEIEPLIRSPIQVGMMNMVPMNLSRLMKKDYDVVLTFKMYPHTGPVGAIAKMFTHKPVVMCIDDFDKASPKNPFKRLVMEISDAFHVFADWKIVLSKKMREMYGGELIYQPIDTDKDRPSRRAVDGLRRKLGLRGKIVITHIGTLYETKGIDILIKAVQRMNRDDVKLMLFEFGKETEKYKAMSGPETIWVKKRTGEKSLDYTLMADIYAIPTRRTRYTEVQTPVKIWESMSMGIPTVATNLGDIPEILENGNAGLVIKPDSVDSLKSALEKLVADKKLRARLGKRGRDVYVKKYHYRIQEKKILDLFDKVGKSLNNRRA